VPDNEPSGPVPVAPVATPAPLAQVAGIQLSGKAIVQALALAFGAAAGGGGISYAVTPTEQILNLSDEIQEMRGELNEAITWQREQNAKSSAFHERTFPDALKRLDDHEQRLRALERGDD